MLLQKRKLVLTLYIIIIYVSPAFSLFGWFSKSKSKKKSSSTLDHLDLELKKSESLAKLKNSSCIACYGGMAGSIISRTRYMGFTNEQKDRSCQSQCQKDSRCEFWVRSTKTHDCFLKQGFRGYLDLDPSENERGGFRKSEDEIGVVFIKQPKTGGETLAELLAQYSVRYGRRVLHDVSCYTAKNPLAQATCGCGLHFVANSRERLPSSDPMMRPRFTMLYTHMFFSPEVLHYFMPAPVAQRLITIVRDPLDVLKSAQKMALLQHTNKAEQHINNSFCQPLAHDLELWVSKCPMAAEGDGSILHYIHPAGHEQLKAILRTAKGRLKSPDSSETKDIVDQAVGRFQGFIIGSQAYFDESILLFEAALGWERSDSVYSTQSMVMHSSHNRPLALKIDEEWEE